MLDAITSFINDNFTYITVISIVLFFILFLISFLSAQSKFKTIMAFFGTKQFDILTYFNHDSMTNKENFVFRIFNKNIHDLRVSSFGYEYLGQTLDLVSSYKKTEQMPDHKHILIQPRDFITYDFELNTLKQFTDGILKQSTLKKPLKAYVIDSLGIKTTRRTPHIKKQLNTIKNKENKVIRLNQIHTKATKTINTLEAKKEKTSSKFNKWIYTQLMAYQTYIKNKSNPK